MTNAGRSPSAEADRRNKDRASRERSLNNNETPPAVVAGLFAATDLVAENTHQWKMFGDGSKDAVDNLLDQPISGSLAKRYEGRVHFLTQNLVEFPDPVEDMLADDQIVRSLIPLTRKDNPEIAQQAADALRTRRTLVTTLDHMGLSADRPAERAADQAPTPQEITLTIQLGQVATAPTVAQ